MFSTGCVPVGSLLVLPLSAIGGQLAAVQMLIDAMIVEGIRTKSIDETDFMTLLEQEMAHSKTTRTCPIKKPSEPSQASLI
ncbi:MAG: hypothetical protein ABJP90_12390 [Paracoccaceae bacterium]